MQLTCTLTYSQQLNFTDREAAQTKHTRSDEQQFQQHLRSCSIFRTNAGYTHAIKWRHLMVPYYGAIKLLHFLKQ